MEENINANTKNDKIIKMKNRLGDEWRDTVYYIIIIGILHCAQRRGHGRHIRTLVKGHNIGIRRRQFSAIVTCREIAPGARDNFPLLCVCVYVCSMW